MNASFAAIAPVFLLVSVVAAQAPAGWVVTASRPNGFFLSSSRTPGSLLPLAGVPNELAQGVSDVIVHSSGAVVAGMVAYPSGSPIRLYALTLSGSTVSDTRSWYLGFALSVLGGGVRRLAEHPDGRVVFLADGIGGSPVTCVQLGVLDLQTQSLSCLMTVPPTAGVFDALCFAPDGSEVYLGQNIGNSGTVYRTPLAGWSPQIVGTTPNAISDLVVDSGGDLVVATTGVTSGVGRMNTQTGVLTPISGTPPIVTGLSVEPETDNLFLTSSSASGWALHYVESGALRTLGTYQTLPRSSVFGLDLVPSIERYGDASAGANAYSWAVHPNAGGIPSLGNNSFSVTATSAPGTAIASALFLGPRPGSLMVAGVEILLEPGPAVVALPFAPGATVAIPLPIPNVAALAGRSVFGQTFHVEGSGRLAASDGVSVHVIVP